MVFDFHLYFYLYFIFSRLQSEEILEERGNFFPTDLCNDSLQTRRYLFAYMHGLKVAIINLPTTNMEMEMFSSSAFIERNL